MKKQLHFIVLILIALLGTSCSQDFDETNSVQPDKKTRIDARNYIFAYKTSGTPELDTRAAIYKNGKWDQNETIYIGFLNGSELAKNKVKEVAKEWQRLINLKFKFEDNVDDTDIRIGFTYNGDRTNWSYLGKEWGSNYNESNGQTMNIYLMDENDVNEINHSDFKGIILRNFGLMLGLVYEYQNLNSPIQIDKTAVFSNLKRFGWTDDHISRFMTRTFNSRTITEYTEYDENSIMALPVSPLWDVNGVGSEKLNNTLSAKDKAFINTIYPKLPADPYEDLPKNPRNILHYMYVWTYYYQSTHGITPADMDNWIPNQLDHDGQANGYWYARDGVQNESIFTSSGTHKVVDCDEISFFAQPLRQALGRNGHFELESLDIRQSDLDGERMFKSKSTDLNTFMSLYGSYYPWGHNILWACFFQNGNGFTMNGSGFQIFTDKTRSTDITNGWGIPTTDIILQLLGELPRHHEFNGTGTRWDDIRDFFFPDAATDVITHASTSWFKLSDNTTTKNISGLGLFPGGVLPNTNVRPVDVIDFGKSHVMPTFKRNGAISLTSFANDGSGLHRKGISVSSSVAYAHGGNIRYARVKTADELGYKLVIDEEADKIIFVSPSDPRQDIPVGMLRGVALRYANRTNKVVTESYKDILGEVKELTTSSIVGIEN